MIIRALFLLFVLAVSARADECVDAAARVAKRTAATVTGVSGGFGDILLSHRSATAMRVMCRPGLPNPEMEIRLAGTPTVQFFFLVGAAAAAMFGDDEDQLIDMTRACVVRAAFDPTMAAHGTVGRTTLDCTVDVDAGKYLIVVMPKTD